MTVSHQLCFRRFVVVVCNRAVSRKSQKNRGRVPRLLHGDPPQPQQVLSRHRLYGLSHSAPIGPAIKAGGRIGLEFVIPSTGCREYVVTDTHGGGCHFCWLLVEASTGVSTVRFMLCASPPTQAVSARRSHSAQHRPSCPPANALAFAGGRAYA